MTSQTPPANNSNNSLNKSKSNHGSNNNLAGGVTTASGAVGQQSQQQQQQPIVSSRYTEFKTYSSTFDALQALEGSGNNGNNGGGAGNSSNNNSINRGGGAIGNGTSVVSCSDSTDGSALMRVSSLPGVTPQHPTSSAAGTETAGDGNSLFCVQFFMFSTPLETVAKHDFPGSWGGLRG